MRVLVVALADPGGCLYWLCHHLRQQGVADARLVCLQAPPTPELQGGPPSDLADLFDGGQELATLQRQAEVLHLVDLLPDAMPLPRTRAARLVLQVSELADETQRRRIRELAARTGAPLLATTPDVPEAQFLAPFVPWWQAPWRPLAVGTHARQRSNALSLFACSPVPLRHHPELEALVDAAERESRRNRELPARVEVLIGKPPRVVLARRRRAHLSLIAPGPGSMGEVLDSLVQGVPAVCDVAPLVRERYEALVGRPMPVVHPSLLPTLLDQLDPFADPDHAVVQWGRDALDPSRWVELASTVYPAAPDVPRVA